MLTKKNHYDQRASPVLDFVPVANITRPVRAEMVDPINMLSLELLMSMFSLNARLVINILMVNPIPPRRPIPIKFLQVKSSCNLASRSFTNAKGTANIPINLPTTRPIIMPSEFAEVRWSAIFDGIRIAVLTKANMGTIMKATGLCKKCCRCNDTFRSSLLSNGITNASNTPAIVA